MKTVDVNDGRLLIRSKVPGHVDFNQSRTFANAQWRTRTSLIQDLSNPF